MDSLSKTLRAVLIGGICITPFITLLVFNSLYFPFITSKAFVFRILIEVLFGLWIILMVREPQLRPRYSWLLGIVTAFVVFVGLANVFAVDSSHALWSNFERMDGYITTVHVFAYFLIAATALTTERVWEWFFHVWLGVGVFLSFYGILQVSGAIETHMSGARIDATLGNSTYLAAVSIFLLFLSIFFAVRHRDEIRRVMFSLLIGSSVFIVHSFISYTSRLNQARAQFGGALPEGVDLPYFADGVHVTLFLLSVVGVCVAGYVLTKHNRIPAWVRTLIHTAAYSLLAILFFTIILLTQTRGAILGALGGLGLTVLLIALFARARPRIQRVMAGAALCAVIVGGLLGGLVVTNTLGVTQERPVLGAIHNTLDNVLGLSRVADIELGGKTVRSRFLLWDMALKGFVEHPIVGWGQGNFSYVFNTYYDPRMHDQEPWFDRAHNVFFEWLVAGGAPALLLYVAIFIAALCYIWYDPERGLLSRMRNSISRVMRTLNRFDAHEPILSRHSTIEKSIFTGMIAAYVFHNIFVFDHLISYLLFFGFLAYIYALYTPDENARIGVGLRVPPMVRRAVVAPVVVVLVVGLVYAVNYRPVKANIELINALRLQGSNQYEAALASHTSALSYNTFGNREIRLTLGNAASQVIQNDSVSSEIKNRYFGAAGREFEKQIQEAPHAIRSRLTYGTMLLRGGQLNRALEQYKKARDLSPSKQFIYYQIANVHFQQNNPREALVVLERAFMLEPSNRKARELYAYGAIVAEDDAALQRARTHEGELTDAHMADNKRILNAYIQTQQWEEVTTLLTERVETLRSRLEDTSSERVQADLLETYQNLAGVHANRNQTSHAVAVLEEAKNALPEHVEHIDQLIARMQEESVR